MSVYVADLLRWRPAEGRELVVRTFRQNGCAPGETARALGVDRVHFWRLMGRYGLRDLLAELRRDYDARYREPPCPTDPTN